MQLEETPLAFESTHVSCEYLACDRPHLLTNSTPGGKDNLRSNLIKFPRNPEYTGINTRV